MIQEKVNDARMYFGIKSYPGNFFDYIVSTEKYIDRLNLLIVKQDMHNLSGCIWYEEGGMPAICINYKKNIGHQNFTLAHEIGHLFLHKGLSMDDEYSNLENSTNCEEKECQANEFAAELLYPLELVKEDFKYIEQNKLLRAKNSDKLADYINELCKKYCISFTFALSRILFTVKYPYSIKEKIRSVKYKIGSLSARYEPYDHIYVHDHPYYRPYIYPLYEMDEFVRKLSEAEMIAVESGKVVIRRNGKMEGWQ